MILALVAIIQNAQIVILNHVNVMMIVLVMIVVVIVVVNKTNFN
jgi:hypothetical protein